MEVRQPTIKDHLLLHVVLLFYSINGILSKKGAMSGFFTEKFFFYYGLVILNLIIYAILWQQILRKMPLTTAFSNKSVIVIWGMIWGALFFKEQITMQMIIGGVIISFGVYLVVTDNG
ncbi:transporter [Desulfitobacterium hafniense]|uniref:Transporter n=1 Tax=Desulfitobacterium hafniense TaxID=49338 RepID=A0A0W1JQ47_DESHA|nr:EamA family transporter [Desulfitobacterium hafniense]KTE93857.1 transporter [Desulfitobacterium hafniense]